MTLEVFCLLNIDKLQRQQTDERFITIQSLPASQMLHPWYSKLIDIEHGKRYLEESV